MIIALSKPSRKYLARCEKDTQASLMGAIEGLPDKGDIQPLKGRRIKSTFRLRVGRYRIIYVRDGEMIRVLDIDTRGDIYK